jgi:hypothetical protein
MTNDTLTEDERAELRNGAQSDLTGAKTLRLIDAQAAALARVRVLLAPGTWEGRPVEVTGVGAGPLRAALAGSPAAPEAPQEYGWTDKRAPQWSHQTRGLAAANARIAELEEVTSTEARVRLRLMNDLDAANARAEAAELNRKKADAETNRLYRERVIPAESESAALRAEVGERRKVDLQNCKLIDSLRAEVAANERRARAFQAGATKMQAERDAANAHLEVIEQHYASYLAPERLLKIRAHLAAQPATARWQCPRCADGHAASEPCAQPATAPTCKTCGELLFDRQALALGFCSGGCAKVKS